MKIYKYGMKRPFGLGTFPKNESVIGVDPDNDRTKTGWYDILWTSEPLSEKEIYDFELKPLDKNYQIEEIASKILNIETLETRNSDSLDFYDLSVWEIKKALSEAYEAGKRNCK